MNRIQRAARRRIPQEIRIDTLSLRDRFLLYAAHPVKAARYLGLRLRKWATLPGDTWCDFQRDQYFVVTKVKPHWIEAEIYDGQVWHNPDLLAQAATAPRIHIGTDTIWGYTYQPGPIVQVGRYSFKDMATWIDACPASSST